MSLLSSYPDHDATALAEKIRSGEFAIDDVLDTVEHLISVLNPDLNAIVRSTVELARDDSQSINRDAPLAGVPSVFKDEYQSIAGVPCDHSSVLASGFTRPYDTALVADYRRAGILFVGKANLPELGASVTTDARLYGPCSTPWRKGLNAGGSSGGSASAVAAGIVPVAYGNDGAGSLRIPASCCGVFGFKPTRARISTAPDGGEYWNGLVIEHAITRSVRDSAALLDISDTPRRGDYYYAPPKPGPWLQAADREPGRLRIGFTSEPLFDAPIHADCKAALEWTARACEDLGHDVDEASPACDGEALRRDVGDLLCIHLAAGVQNMSELFGRPVSAQTVERATLALAERGRAMSATALLAILDRFAATARRASAFWEDYDVWLTPTLAQPPLPNGTIYTDDPDAENYYKRWFDFVPFTPLANVMGAPAMNVPLFWSAEDLPIGSHFMAEPGREDLLFSLAAQLERAYPWVNRKPPLSAWNVLRG